MRPQAKEAKDSQESPEAGTEGRKGSPLEPPDLGHLHPQNCGTGPSVALSPQHVGLRFGSRGRLLHVGRATVPRPDCRIPLPDDWKSQACCARRSWPCGQRPVGTRLDGAILSWPCWMFSVPQAGPHLLATGSGPSQAHTHCSCWAHLLASCPLRPGTRDQASVLAPCGGPSSRSLPWALSHRTTCPIARAGSLLHLELESSPTNAPSTFKDRTI